MHLDRLEGFGIASVGIEKKGSCWGLLGWRMIHCCRLMRMVEVRSWRKSSKVTPNSGRT